MTVDELEKYGLRPMDETAVWDVLEDQSIGVLGLPDEGVPYMIPLSYASDSDGESLYFTYLVGATSEKQRLTERSGRARFLVYDVETMFRWRSVLLTGGLSAVPDDERADIQHVLADAWRPSVLDSASTSGGIEVYEFEIQDWTGIQQSGLAPDFRENVQP
jgi:nitroimidazol reductase NimA-like FMN-containing flavoprotein (pyridoxamine 5'-phosphate oxidase superfamily)